MSNIMNFIEFIISKKEQIFELFIQHIYLTFLAIVLAILVGVPLGILITRNKTIRKPILGFINLIQAVPSMALLGLLIPILGIGSVPAISMVVVYSLLPIVKNTYTGLSSIDPDMLEAANGMGLTKNQTLTKIQLPLALPIIMAGVRISAVTSVGLMTLAAFIGGGGLGYLVFSGIQTVNNNMILAGAIPSCILALIVDYIFGKIEIIVSPKGLNPTQKKPNTIVLKVMAGIMALILLAVGFNTIKNIGKETVVVGSKNFTEQLILGNMISDLIEENTDLNVVRKLNLSGSSVAVAAIENKEIDMYVDYVGTVLMNILKEPVNNDKNQAFKDAKKGMEAEYGVTMLDPLGFNNTYSIAVKKSTAEKYGLNTISDLTKVSKNLVFSPTLEFENRDDGLLGLQKLYGIEFKNIIAMDGSLRYTAMEKDECQAMDAFSTDGLLKAFDLKTLKDDKNLFPPYEASILIREETLSKYTELNTVLNKLTGKLNEEIMIDLNYKVDKLGESPEKVARDYLIENGLYNK